MYSFWVARALIHAFKSAQRPLHALRLVTDTWVRNARTGKE
jgi:hypothetical protein